MAKIGVLGLQGAVREHAQMIQALGEEAVIIKQKEQLASVDGLILPGGESTTIRRLIDQYDFYEPLVQFGKAGKPILGTCAGLILLANEISGQNDTHLGLIDIKAVRNGFGRQRDSFEATISIKGVAENFEAVFIRAPYIEEVGPNVEVLATYDGRIVAAQEGNIICSAFHPELTNDRRMTQYFVDMVRESNVITQE